MSLFVCLFNLSLRTETRLGPDGTRLEQNARLGFRAFISMLANWSMEMQIVRNSLMSAFGTRERRSFIQSKLPLRLSVQVINIF